MEDQVQKPRTNLAVISLGSNINREENLPEAVAELARQCTVLSVSSIYETEPVGREDQPLFWNAAVLLKTELSPAGLKSQVLEKIEKSLGRIRQPDRNAPRTIDVDLTLYNRQIIRINGGQILPDPDLLRHIHVALPIAELLPEETHPETGEPYPQIAERLLSILREQRRPFPTKVEGVDLLETISSTKKENSRSN